jgi:hypothetical protein
MGVIGSQYKGMNRTTCSLSILLQTIKAEPIITICKETYLAIISTVNDVQRCTFQEEAGTSWHRKPNTVQ